MWENSLEPQCSEADPLKRQATWVALRQRSRDKDVFHASHRLYVVILLFPEIPLHMVPVPTCHKAASWAGDRQVTLLSQISQCKMSLIDKTGYVPYLLDLLDLSIYLWGEFMEICNPIQGPITWKDEPTVYHIQSGLDFLPCYWCVGQH